MQDEAPQYRELYADKERELEQLKQETAEHAQVPLADNHRYVITTKPVSACRRDANPLFDDFQLLFSR